MDKGTKYACQKRENCWLTDRQILGTDESTKLVWPYIVRLQCKGFSESNNLRHKWLRVVKFWSNHPCSNYWWQDPDCSVPLPAQELQMVLQSVIWTSGQPNHMGIHQNEYTNHANKLWESWMKSGNGVTGENLWGGVRSVQGTFLGRKLSDCEVMVVREHS